MVRINQKKGRSTTVSRSIYVSMGIPPKRQSTIDAQHSHLGTLATFTDDPKPLLFSPIQKCQCQDMVKFDLEGWVGTVTVPPQHSTKDKQSLGAFPRSPSHTSIPKRIAPPPQAAPKQRQAVSVGAYVLKVPCEWHHNVLIPCFRIGLVP